MSVIGWVKNIVGEGENDNLTLSQTTHFRQLQTERACRRQFQIWWKWQNVLQMDENTVGKGEFARYEQFILFPYCFEKTSNADT